MKKLFLVWKGFPLLIRVPRFNMVNWRMSDKVWCRANKYSWKKKDNWLKRIWEDWNQKIKLAPWLWQNDWRFRNQRSISKSCRRDSNERFRIVLIRNNRFILNSPWLVKRGGKVKQRYLQLTTRLRMLSICMMMLSRCWRKQIDCPVRTQRQISNLKFRRANVTQKCDTSFQTNFVSSKSTSLRSKTKIGKSNLQFELPYKIERATERIIVRVSSTIQNSPNSASLQYLHKHYLRLFMKGVSHQKKSMRKKSRTLASSPIFTLNQSRESRLNHNVQNSLFALLTVTRLLKMPRQNTFVLRHNRDPMGTTLQKQLLSD